MLILLGLATLTTFTDTLDARSGEPPGVSYRIEAVLDENTHVLSGRAELRYHNRSSRQIDTLFFHQHLNAFRPHSAWARRELEFDVRRFQDLGPAQHAFERLRSARIGGVELRPHYPGAPDSTVLALPLPRPLEPGDSVTVVLEWDARLATTPRRQGREGRHYDWAHWYPRIAVHDAEGWQVQALLPQGEFWGEFAHYDVTLRVAHDQVLAATGVPVAGDPGWERASAGAASPGRPRGATPPGLREVRWVAESVIHFAWNADPEFIYEGGSWREIPIHVLYRRGSAAEWGGGTALERTRVAMAWAEELFGPYPYPQLTNVERIERGGTEFPMLIMNGSASLGLIVHEVLHQYAHAILASNEWREGWLDEGLTSFLGSWFSEARGEPVAWGRQLATIAARERAGATQPIATPGAEFTDFATYQAMTYTKASLVFRMLRWLIGEEAFRAALRLYYERHRLSHVDEMDLRRAMEDASGRDLEWFFDQWLHTTHALDYAVPAATTRQRGDGRWVTSVEVLRLGEAWMPVTLQVGEERVTLTSRERRQQVEVVTRQRPSAAVLDPENVLLDIDPTNDAMTIAVP
jgi:hypothetical protein